ncbi:Hsp20 family protein [Vibrio renipiscarius]|uniref:Heat-shock protein Hsp20 n=1 Tax=Vibrio renipiscarius TaxID=1461322 RepID=A0A0C2NH69_9VIBR|nr:Hsp20 family protein [Vibrio renipiscarius]KII75665.1 heat-shock protein Hsp20 [Vibrio renipiscarius]KII81885.1 heat-shock protein Hsp20 [Vibrio renipiscarius]
MRNVDISPLYRHAIGFDRLFNLVENNAKKTPQTGYPPYNIEQKDEHNYRITMAVAGFSEDALTLTQNENMLIVSGEIKAEETKTTYVYQGIAERNFERKFQLADYVTVSAASMENGLLHIDLVREVPEAMQPRKIAINK